MRKWSFQFFADRYGARPHLTNTNLNRDLDAHPTNKLLLGVFWIYAIVPLAWGVINTLVQATKLFQ